MCKPYKNQNYQNKPQLNAGKTKEGNSKAKYISPELRLHWNLKAKIIHAATKHANTNKTARKE